MQRHGHDLKTLRLEGGQNMVSEPLGGVMAPVAPGLACTVYTLHSVPNLHRPNIVGTSRRPHLQPSPCTVVTSSAMTSPLQTVTSLPALPRHLVMSPRDDKIPTLTR